MLQLWWRRTYYSFFFFLQHVTLEYTFFSPVLASHFGAHLFLSLLTELPFEQHLHQ